MWNSCCDCKDCPFEGCDFEECDCECCEVTCKDYNQLTVKKRRLIRDPLKLYNAIVAEDKLKICEILQQTDVNLRTVYENGNRALHLVFQNFVEKDVIEILQVFLTKDVDLYFENEDKETILHFAVSKRMKKTIDFLLKNGFEIEMIYKPSNPVPHFFIENEYEQFLKLPGLEDNDSAHCNREKLEIEGINFVEWFISKGFDFDRRTHGKQSALQLAIERNLQHILPTLLKHSNDINFVSENYQRTLLHSFIQVNNAYKERKPFCSYVGVWSVDFTKQYALEILKILLDKGISVDTVDIFGNTALHMAIQTNVKMGIFEMLLDRFTNVHQKNKWGRTLLHEVTVSASSAASESEAEAYLRIMRSLIAKGADVNTKDKEGYLPVYELVKAKNLPAIELMKENNADFNVTIFEYYRYTLLHVLARKECHDKSTNESQEAICDLLIGQGCDVNALDEDGLSPLHIAARNNYIAVARKLIAHGASVNCRENERQMTPLHFAMERKVGVEVAVLLLDKGANINSKSHCGRRPLDLAVAHNCSHMVKMLLGRGAHVHARDNEGKTALSFAVQYNRLTNIEELLKYGANINDSQVVSEVNKLFQHEDRVVDLVLKHWAKLKAANLPGLEEYRAFVEDVNYQGFYQRCLEEIELLKSTYIGDHTTLHTFLQVHPNRRRAYAYCEMLQKHVDSPLFQEQFPKYSVLILGNYRTAIARNSLLDKAKEAWLELTEITLPDVCIEQILAFLDNADLIDMVEEC